MTMKEKCEIMRSKSAMDNFQKGYNCAQAIVLAFADMIPIEEELLLRMASSFGGGMGRLREVCGAMSGMFMVVGALYGYDDSKEAKIKAEHYARIQELAGRFEEKNGSIVCRELLGLNIKHDSSVPKERTQEYYKKRPCPQLVADAAKILEDYIHKNPPKGCESTVRNGQKTVK